jgi:hypothetical protein
MTGWQRVGKPDFSDAISPCRIAGLTVDADRYEQNVSAPALLEEVYDFPDSNFSLFHRGHNTGFGFKKTGP